jgi:predicted nucleic acid-binding protein
MISLPGSRFVDANVFINWLKATPSKAVSDENASLSGYILHKIEEGEEAFTTVTVKDEVAIWLSRYKIESLQKFLELLTGYTTFEIVAPNIEEQAEAGKLMKKYNLGYTDLLSLITMKRCGVKEIYTSDTGFDDIPDIKRIFQELRNEQGYIGFMDLIKNYEKLHL